jgi:hypothetical protein
MNKEKPYVDDKNSCWVSPFYKTQEYHVGVYGDSFARETSCRRNNYNKVHVINGFWLHDPSILENYAVTNYAIPGSDFLYSYEMFKKTHHNYDKIIFMVTESQRFHIKLNDEYYFFHGSHIVRESVDKIVDDVSRRAGFTESHGDKLRKTIESLKYYYAYVNNSAVLDAGTEFLVEDIKSIRPDAIIERAFLTPFSKSNFCLSYVSSLDNNALPKQRLNYVCCRHSHMNPTNNKIYASYIKKRLDGENPEISVNDFVACTAEDAEHLFVDIKERNNVIL